jgi:hypothetical protein
MDEKTHWFLWLLACGGSFGLLGGLFGIVTGIVTWRDGRSAGTPLGLSVAQAFSRAAGHPLSPTRMGTLVGGTDGMVFGSGVGLLGGAFLPIDPSESWRFLFWAVLVGGALGASAVGMGLLAQFMVRRGTVVVVGLFVGGLSGGGAGFFVAGSSGLFVGTLLGGLLGALVSGSSRNRGPDD